MFLRLQAVFPGPISQRDLSQGAGRPHGLGGDGAVRFLFRKSPPGLVSGGMVGPGKLGRRRPGRPGVHWPGAMDRRKRQIQGMCRMQNGQKSVMRGVRVSKACREPPTPASGLGNGDRALFLSQRRSAPAVC